MTDKSGASDLRGTHERVKGIFTEIASDYDRVNRVISLGQIERWRRMLVSRMEIPEDGHVLDLGCGTGRLTRLIADQVRQGKVVGVDLTPAMIEIAQKTLPAEYGKVVDFFTGTAEELDLRSNSFDVVTSAFTLRNVSDLTKVISEMKRVAKPGGTVYSLELAKPRSLGFREIYRVYFDKILPLLGGIIQGNTAPYRYLAESLKKFPDQDKLKRLFQKAGLLEVEYHELFGGVAGIHQGEKREN